MDEATIRTKVKEIIANTMSIEPEDISDSANFEEDLDLDSLTLLEIAVDVDHVFKLNIPDEELSERLSDLRSLQDSVDLVKEHMSSTGVEA
ncbi:MAG: acyl carrier protein [Candidatus Latescibacteria bacterium]|jgi:acyl carrier protein|nr:acyl carrier protein [Candidatus Latescibacterota bacterium]